MRLMLLPVGVAAVRLVFQTVQHGLQPVHNLLPEPHQMHIPRTPKLAPLSTFPLILQHKLHKPPPAPDFLLIAPEQSLLANPINFRGIHQFVELGAELLAIALVVKELAQVD